MAAASPPRPVTDLREVEDAGALGEELALLREEQAEARQVDDFLVGLHLREVGVIREVGDQIVGEADLEVAAVLRVGVELRVRPT